MERKVCKKCGRRLPLTEYYKNMLTRDGHMGSCKRCINEYTKEYNRQRRQKEKLKMMNRNAQIL